MCSIDLWFYLLLACAGVSGGLQLQAMFKRIHLDIDYRRAMTSGAICCIVAMIIYNIAISFVVPLSMKDQVMLLTTCSLSFVPPVIVALRTDYIIVTIWPD